MKITIVGAGYVGLVSAACFAELGNQVLCVERDAERVERLKNVQATQYRLFRFDPTGAIRACRRWRSRDPRTHCGDCGVCRVGQLYPASADRAVAGPVRPD